jgi:hypothetical protein
VQPPPVLVEQEMDELVANACSSTLREAAEIVTFCPHQ